jgi:hypothetical protein
LVSGLGKVKVLLNEVNDSLRLNITIEDNVWSMVVQIDTFDARNLFPKAIAGVLAALMATTLIRCLVSDRELRTRLRRAVEVYNAVHLGMFLEDNPLRLSAN